jgi:hypothetical protein
MGRGQRCNTPDLGHATRAGDVRLRDIECAARKQILEVEPRELALPRGNGDCRRSAHLRLTGVIVGRQVRGPALVNVFEGGKTPMVPASELAEMGFRLGIYPSQTHRAAIRAAQKVLAALKEDGDTRRIEGDLATFQEREDAVGTARWRALEDMYLRIER